MPLKEQSHKPCRAHDHNLVGIIVLILNIVNTNNLSLTNILMPRKRPSSRQRYYRRLGPSEFSCSCTWNHHGLTCYYSPKCKKRQPLDPLLDYAAGLIFEEASEYGMPGFRHLKEAYAKPGAECRIGA